MTLTEKLKAMQRALAEQPLLTANEQSLLKKPVPFASLKRAEALLRRGNWQPDPADPQQAHLRLEGRLPENDFAALNQLATATLFELDGKLPASLPIQQNPQTPQNLCMASPMAARRVELALNLRGRAIAD
jgi:hypothetical protein